MPRTFIFLQVHALGRHGNVLHLPQRQSEGFMSSLSRLMKSAISVPDYSNISKRSIHYPHVLSQAVHPGNLR
jgi:hypothetical protein